MRLISPKTGQDTKLGELVSFYGTGLGLFYILLIPQADDWAVVKDVTPDQLKIMVMPTFQQVTPNDIAIWLTALHNHDFVFWDQLEEKIYFDPKRFYKYQSKIAKERRRADNDHPQRTCLLKMPTIATSAETWQKLDEVWALVPKSVQKSWTYHQLRESIEAHSDLTLYQVKMAMLGVLEKFDGKRTDIGFLFSNALKWRSESELTNLPGSVTYGEYQDQYKKMMTQSELELKESVAELRELMERR